MPLVDPPEAPEGGGSIRAGDLLNKICLFRPESIGEWPAREAETDEEGNVTRQASGPKPYVECSVWVLDRAGVIEEGEGVRVSWWKAFEQLKNQIGNYVGANPVKDQGSNAVSLVPLRGEAREVAAKVVSELEARELEANGEPF